MVAVISNGTAVLGPERSKIYPFCKLTGPANILVMPGLHAANI